MRVIHRALCIILILLVSSCNRVNIEDQIDTSFSSSQNTEIDPEYNVTPEKPKEEKLTLIMFGDALLHKAVYTDAETQVGFQDTGCTTKTYDFSHMLQYIKPIVQGYDLAFYNQETILGGTELGLSTYPRFNSPQEFGDAMIEAGFNLVSLANNHTLDKNEAGVLSSRKYWLDKMSGCEIIASGSYESQEDRDKPRILEKNGIRYTLLAYTYGTNGIPIPNGKGYLVNVYDEEMLKKDIAEIRDKVDLLIVSIHWGNEYTFKPTQHQKYIAKLLINAGADIVIGHHPHVIQPIELVDGQPVIYSLGNMISNQDQLYCQIGMMVGCNVIKVCDEDGSGVGERDGAIKRRIKIDNIKPELIYTSRDKNNKNFRIIPFSILNDDVLKDYKEIEKRYMEKIGYCSSEPNVF